MRCLALAALLLMAGLSPTTLRAQDVRVNEATVQSCFAYAGPGEVAPACLGAASNACQQTNASTLGISLCIQAETAVWDSLLNREYQARQSQFSAQDPAGGIGNALRDAQRAWIVYRDAECGLAYARWQDGSMRVIVAANCLMTMTAQRAIELRDMKGN